MDPNVVLIQILAFLAVFLFVLGLKAAFRSTGRVSEEQGKPLLFRIFNSESKAFEKVLEPGVSRMFASQSEQLRRDLVAGALPLQVGEIRGMQGLAAASLGLGGAVVVFLATMHGGYAVAALVGGGFLGWLYPAIFVGRTARLRKDRMSKSLPFAIDLIAVAMEAGQDFGAAVRNLVKQGPKDALTQEFAVALHETELGKSRIDALKAMADRVQLDEFRSMTSAVAQSAEMGSSLVQTLKIQSEEIRRARYHVAERKAARAPSLMLIPMALFILPAVFIIIFTPVVIRVMDSGMSKYFGG